MSCVQVLQRLPEELRWTTLESANAVKQEWRADLAVGRQRNVEDIHLAMEVWAMNEGVVAVPGAGRHCCAMWAGRPCPW